jgi:septum formation protein
VASQKYGTVSRMSEPRSIILASQSPQRQLLFRELHVPFESVPADIDEQAIQHTDLAKRAELVARAKAEKVAAQHPQAIIIAADTYIVMAGKALEKPTSEAEAITMLQAQSGQTTTEVTGLCYIDPLLRLNVSKTVSTQVTFRDLSLTEIERYVKNNPVLGFSGAFCPAYPAGGALIATITGSFTSFTHGLPLDEIVPLLKQSGVEL